MEAKVRIHINNAPASINGKFIVARLVDSELWYYGAWPERRAAQYVADQIGDAIVLEGVA